MSYAKGKYAKAISDRSGLAFPYNEMRKEWNGSFDHTSEFEVKHPQLEPKNRRADAQALKNARIPIKLEPSDQIENGTLNSLQKTLGHTAKTFASSFTSDSASPLVTSLTLTVSLGNESISVS